MSQEVSLNVTAIPVPDDTQIAYITPYILSFIEQYGAKLNLHDSPIVIGQVIDASLMRAKAAPVDLNRMLDRLVIVADPNFAPAIMEALNRIAPRDIESNPELEEKRGNPRKARAAPKMKLRTLYQKMTDQNLSVQTVSFAEGEDFEGFFCFVRTKFTVDELFKELGIKPKDNA